MTNSDLSQLVQQLCQRVEALEGEVAVLKAGASSIGSLGGFSQTPKTIPVTVKREGDYLWYVSDKDDLDKHNPITEDRLVGRFVTMGVTTSQYEGEYVPVAVLYVQVDANTVYKLRMNAKLEPKSSVPLKAFLSSMETVPDEALLQPLGFKVYPGKKASTVMVQIFDPASGRGFERTDDNDTDDEDLAARWRDTDRFHALLKTTIDRIQKAATSQAPASRSMPVTEAKKVAGSPPKHKTLQTIVGQLGSKGQVETSQKDGSSFIRFTLTNAQGKVYQSFARDEVARKIDMLYVGPVWLSAVGNSKGKSGAVFFEVVEIEATEPPALDKSINPVDLSDVLVKTDVEMSRVGWSKSAGRNYLKQKYGKSQRAQLTTEEMNDFLTHLMTLPTASQPASV